MFDRRRERKNQVAQSHDRWVHKDILRHVELELVQGLLPAFRRRSHACKGIRAEPIAHLILIDSVILFQAIERHVRQGTRTRSCLLYTSQEALRQEFSFPFQTARRSKQRTNDELPVLQQEMPRNLREGMPRIPRRTGTL